MNGDGSALRRFYSSIRKLQDQEKITEHQLLGLFFDLYELLVAFSAAQAADEALSKMFGGGGNFSFHKVDPDTFEEVVKRDKKDDPPVPEGRIGPYL